MGAASPPVGEAVSEGADTASLSLPPPVLLTPLLAPAPPEPPELPDGAVSLSPLPPVPEELLAASSDSLEPLGVEVDVAADPPAASDNLKASAAAVGSALEVGEETEEEEEAPEGAEAVDVDAEVVEDPPDDALAGAVNPAAGRSGRRTSM